MTQACIYVLTTHLAKVEDFLIIPLLHFISKPWWDLPLILGLMYSEAAFLRANVVSSMGLLAARNQPHRSSWAKNCIWAIPGFQSGLCCHLRLQSSPLWGFSGLKAEGPDGGLAGPFAANCSAVLQLQPLMTNNLISLQIPACDFGALLLLVKNLFFCCLWCSQKIHVVYVQISDSQGSQLYVLCWNSS